MDKCHTMKVVILGAGNLATNLAHALYKAHHSITQVYSRTEESAQILAKQVGAAAINDVSLLSSDADMYLVSVSDSALSDVLQRAVKGREDAFFVHTAGSMPMDVIPTQRRGVLYPMQTFSKQRLVDFISIPIFFEASNDNDLGMLERLGQSVSQRVYQLCSADRVYLHLAAVFCSNFANHCYTLSAEILHAHNIPFDVMLPLIDEVAEKVHSVSPENAQTGPAVRHDWNVINKHLQLLSADPLKQQIYRIMSNSIAND